MGKKSKRTTEEKASSKVNAKIKRKLDDLVDQLLQVCTTLISPGTKEWDEYIKINQLVTQIQEIEKAYAPPKLNRSDQLEPFLKWLVSHDTNLESVEIEEFEGCGYGLKATKEIKEGGVILSVPRTLMLSIETAKKSKLGQFIESDSILQCMSNVTLALHLLNESCDPNSFWTPFIQFLPSEYDTPLYLSTDEMQYLKGTVTLEDAIKQCRHIARQYAYFYKIFKSHPNAKHLALRDHFTYDKYRWAVSAVMTRQNLIPSDDGREQMLALVPLWDLCNHTNGKFSTDFNTGKKSIECFAFRDFQAGEQVYIFYGTRSNSEFFVHNGFVYKDNLYDHIDIRLDLRKSDACLAKKEQLLTKLGMTTSEVFRLYRSPNAVEGKLLAFHRIIAMSPDLVDHWLLEERWKQLVESVCDIDSKTEQLCWKLLETRINAMRTNYPTTIEEDERLLSDGQLSVRAKMAVELSLCEKIILRDVLQFIEHKGSK